LESDIGNTSSADPVAVSMGLFPAVSASILTSRNPERGGSSVSQSSDSSLTIDAAGARQLITPAMWAVAVNACKPAFASFLHDEPSILDSSKRRKSALKRSDGFKEQCMKALLTSQASKQT